jgi:hypothetical protein
LTIRISPADILLPHKLQSFWRFAQLLMFVIQKFSTETCVTTGCEIGSAVLAFAQVEASAMRISVFSLVLLFVSASAAQAEPKSLMLTNRSGETVTAIAANARSNPEAVIAVTLGAAIANDETAFFALDLPEGTCLADLVYTLSSNSFTTQSGVDVCNLDGIVVE